MTQIAINYSPQAARLLAEGRVEFDYFKCPDWPDMIAEALKLKPTAVHFTLMAGNGSLKDKDLTPIEALKLETGTPFVNLHLGAPRKNFPTIPVMETDPQVFRSVVDLLLQDVALAVEHFGSESVIIENIPFRGPGDDFLRACVDPGVISQITAETGCGLLLDIPHARISAHHLKMDEKDYMQALPVHKLKELHFTGVHEVNGRLQDHLPALPDDWRALDWVSSNIQQGAWPAPWLAAFEYGGVGDWFELRSDAAVIAEQLPKIFKKIRRGE